MFLRPESMKYNNYLIHPNWRLTSDHALLTINICIFKKYVQTRKQTLVKNNKEEEHFLEDLIEAIKEINIANLQSTKVFESTIQLFTHYTDKIWYKYSKITNITKYSKE